MSELEVEESGKTDQSLSMKTDVPHYVAFFEAFQQRELEDTSRDPSKIKIRNYLCDVSTLSNSMHGD